MVTYTQAKIQKFGSGSAPPDLHLQLVAPRLFSLQVSLHMGSITSSTLITRLVSILRLANTVTITVSIGGGTLAGTLFNTLKLLEPLIRRTHNQGP